MEKSGERLKVKWKSQENVLRRNGKVRRTSEGEMEKSGERLKVKWKSQENVLR